MGVQGRTCGSSADFHATDSQPRIWPLRDSNKRPSYGIKPPCGHPSHIGSGGFALDEHQVAEHDDGTFTIEHRPANDPENSNSILCPFCSWHGFVRRNVWEEI